MWGSDLTSVMTGEGQAAVFIAVDHCSAECVGIHASRSADRFEALEPVRQAVRERFGTFAKAPPPAFNSATIMAASMSATTSRLRSASSASRAHRLSSASPKAMAVPNGSSGC